MISIIFSFFREYLSLPNITKAPESGIFISASKVLDFDKMV